MTTAIALRVMEQPTSFLGRLSADAFGQQLRQWLTQNRVDLGLTVTAAQPTSLAVVDLDDQGRASYTFHFQGTANFAWQAQELPPLGPADWVHAGTLAAVVEPGAQVLLDWAREQPGGISFDVNARPDVIGDARQYWHKIRPWLEVAGERSASGAGGIVKASDDDLEFLAQGIPGSAQTGSAADTSSRDDAVQPMMRHAAVQLMEHWVAEFGLDLGLVTLGPHGAVALSPTSAIAVPGHVVTVADTISAGDTFMAGFLSAYAEDRDDLSAALGRAVAASALVVTRVGANPPTIAEVRAFQQDAR